MACTTALRLTNNLSNPQSRIKVVTQTVFHPANPQESIGIDVRWFQCGEDWIPNGLLGTNLRDESEETFHRDIRRGAIRARTFVKEESTNPELNYNEDGSEITE